MTAAVWAPDTYPGMRFPPPRPFQASAREAAQALRRAGKRRIMVCSPTGSGKTIFAMYLLYECLIKGLPAIFVCDRITLIDQTVETAWKLGFRDIGVMQADHPMTNPNALLQIASAQTLMARGWPKASLIIVDEAHTQYAVITNHIDATDATVIGLSATPFSKGLGLHYDAVINATTMAELNALGTLTPLRVFAGVRPDMSGAAIAGGEWTDRAAEERGMEIVGDVVSSWFKHAAGRQTICFGATIRHCEEICRHFIEAGVAARVYCAITPDAERKEILAGFKAGLIQALVSVEALAKGFDVPAVSAIVDCRPLRKSFSTVVQMWGRGLRASPETGKQDCILLDLSGNSARFAADWVNLRERGVSSLSAAEKLDAVARKDDNDKPEPGNCPVCGHWPFLRRCLGCGHEVQGKALVEHQAGDTTEIILGGKVLASSPEHLFGQLLDYATAHSAPEKVLARAKTLYHQLTGALPEHGWNAETVPAVPVTLDTHNRIAYVQIRRMKGQR